MRTFYAIFAATLLVISAVTLILGDYEATRYTIVCSFLCQILMRLEEKGDD